MDSISFEGRVAVVTGAGRGLGRAYAMELARRGAKVVVNDVPASPDLEDAVQEIRATGAVAMAAGGSVADPAEAQALIDNTLAAFGRIDVLINNAGILRPGYFDELSAEAIDSVLSVHLKGAFNVSQPAFRAMRAAGYGRIVNTSSSSIFGFVGMSNYAAAKAGLLGLTNTLALEGAPHGIRANTVLPASNTPMTKNALSSVPIPGFAADERWNEMRAIMLPRYHPEGVAALVTLLASEACPVSGQAFSAMAGRYARVFIGISEGWLSPDGAHMSAENVLAHMGEITACERFRVPSKSREEFEATAARVAALKG